MPDGTIGKVAAWWVHIITSRSMVGSHLMKYSVLDKNTGTHEHGFLCLYVTCSGSVEG